MLSAVSCRADSGAFPFCDENAAARSRKNRHECGNYPYSCAVPQTTLYYRDSSLSRGTVSARFSVKELSPPQRPSGWLCRRRLHAFVDIAEIIVLLRASVKISFWCAYIIVANPCDNVRRHGGKPPLTVLTVHTDAAAVRRTNPLPDIRR